MLSVLFLLFSFILKTLKLVITVIPFLYTINPKKYEAGRKTEENITNYNGTDSLLKGLLENMGDWIVDFDTHDKFLNNSEAELSEAEKEIAIRDFEIDRENGNMCTLIFGNNISNSDAEKEYKKNPKRRKLDDIQDTRTRVILSNSVIASYPVRTYSTAQPGTVNEQLQLCSSNIVCCTSVCTVFFKQRLNFGI